MAPESGVGNGAPAAGTPPYDDSFSETDVTATENTPLLPSEVSSQTLRDASSATGEQRTSPDDDDVAAHSVSPIRAVCIVLSMWALIFLQGKGTTKYTNLSLAHILVS